MIERLILVYIFLAFSIGLTCMGVTIGLARREDATLARAFLVFYVSLSVLVLDALLLAFVQAQPAPADPSTLFTLEYIESMIGSYSVMFTLPFFAHRVFGVTDRRRDVVILAVTLLALIGQHFTEYSLPEVWDDRGDTAENILFVGVVAYTLWVGGSRINAPGIDRRLGLRLLALIAIGVPGFLFDVFRSESTSLRFYPLWYCLLSVVVTASLIRQRPSIPAPRAGPDWGLSSREVEVLQLVRRGLSNREIGLRLHISPNTVKTHLRAVFEKTGAHSRFELMALGARSSVDAPENHPSG